MGGTAVGRRCPRSGTRDICPKRNSAPPRPEMAPEPSGRACWTSTAERRRWRPVETPLRMMAVSPLWPQTSAALPPPRPRPARPCPRPLRRPWRGGKRERGRESRSLLLRHHHCLRHLLGLGRRQWPCDEGGRPPSDWPAEKAGILRSVSLLKCGGCSSRRRGIKAISDLRTHRASIVLFVVISVSSSTARARFAGWQTDFQQTDRSERSERASSVRCGGVVALLLLLLLLQSLAWQVCLAASSCHNSGPAEPTEHRADIDRKSQRRRHEKHSAQNTVLTSGRAGSARLLRSSNIHLDALRDFLNWAKNSPVICIVHYIMRSRWIMKAVLPKVYTYVQFYGDAIRTRCGDCGH